MGTPHYSSPEMIMGKPYNYATDLWSLGCIIYEMVCGYVPFGEDADETTLVWELIEECKLEWPEFIPEDSPVRDLVERLLSKNSNKRSSPYKIKLHRWFKQIEWEDYPNKSIEDVPFIPEVPEKPLNPDTRDWDTIVESWEKRIGFYKEKEQEDVYKDF